MKNHYYKTKMVKMGQWSLLPGDSETWHGEHTGRYFQKLFGVSKYLLCLGNLKNGFQYMYVAQENLDALFSQIGKINSKNYKALEKKFKTFYPLVKKAKQISAHNLNSASLSNEQLAEQFFKIRDRIHHLAIFDQFTWLGEEYWTPKIEKVLTGKLGLKKASEEYNKVLFALTKPEEISTTLLEKQAVIEQAIKVKNRKQNLKAAGKILANKFGWLPVFCYGEPWTGGHYEKELSSVVKKDAKVLLADLKKLKDYTKVRNEELNFYVKKYKIKPKDLQVFIDFGLAIDTRNEAEYFVSFGGFYLIPLYKEIAKRLCLSVKQVRFLTEKEMLNAVVGKADADKLLAEKGQWVGWGFEKSTNKRINFSSQETQKLFKYIESYVKPIQGGDEGKGVCASPGKVVGKIRIIPSPEQNNKVKDGDILVTFATTTDYLPAMKRASAIITEVGGLTCHAAVVSREFGIPCIVALANAMKNFKDGEMVEVDANKGVVKKL